METTENKPVISPADTNTAMGVLAYLGPLVIISYIVANDNPFVKFHIKQGLVLLIVALILGVLRTSMSYWMLLDLLNLAVLVLAVLGIINVLQKRERPLPFIGGWAKHFNF